MTTKNRLKRAPDRRNINLPLAMIGSGLLLIGAVSAVWVINSLKDNALETSAGNNYRSVIPATVNFPAPELSLNDLNGDTIHLNDYPGSVVLVNNWATWCPPCAAEMPTLQTYYQNHANDGFILLAIEAGDPLPDVVQFVADYQLTFPVLLDPMNLSLRAFGNDALPSSYVIDQEGLVRLAWTGPISLENLETFVTPLLED
jgi:thiol-disulfide isomerase/thioredoxin